MSMLYEIARIYGTWLHRVMFRSYKIVGRENIPADGCIIVAPNHTSAMDDALSAVAAMDRGVAFVARAQLFKSPILAPICRWLNMMPIGRIRDGLDAVRSNDKTFEEAIRIMQNGTPFVIFPEGTMRSKHRSLLPLVKGAFRIALQANVTLNDNDNDNDNGSDNDNNSDSDSSSKKVYILPVGIVYDDFFWYGDGCRIEIDKPIDVTAIVSSHPEEDTPHLLNRLRDMVSERLNRLVDIPAQSLRYWHTASLVLLAPLFALSVAVLWPFWLMEAYIHFAIDDHGFDRTFRFSLLFVLGIVTLGTILPFATFATHYAASLRHKLGHKPAEQELIP